MTATEDQTEPPVADGEPASGDAASEDAAAADEASGDAVPAGGSDDADSSGGDDFGSSVEDGAYQSLPEDAIGAYYRVSDNDFSGSPTVFGAGGVAVGVTITTDQAHSRDPFVTGPVPDRSVGRAVDTYAPTPSDQELWRRLEEQSVICLSGPAHGGMPSTAIVALAERCGRDKLARVILLERGLGRLVNEPRLLREGYGHILDLGDERIGPHHLEALETGAHRAGATVIVVSRSNERDHELTSYLVRHSPPAPMDVFARWLRYELREAGRCVGRCPGCLRRCHADYLDRCLADEQVGTRLRSVEEVAEAVELARYCARDAQLDGQLHIPENTALLRRRASKALAVHQDPAGGRRTAQHMQAFRIGYALLNGASMTHVFDAVGLLMDRLDEAQHRSAVGRPVLKQDIDALLGDLRPDRDEPEGTAVSGTARRAWLRSPRLAEAILDVAWNEYDSLRAPLLEWVRELGGPQHAGVRPYVAAAAGRLCGYDFDKLRKTVLDVWASDQRPTVRQTAALALESAARNEHVSPKVLHYVRELVLDPVFYRRDVAIRAYATRFGWMFYPYALVDLGWLARDRFFERYDAVARAVAGLYRPDTAREVLETVRRWAEAEEPELRAHADSSLVFLARRMDGTRDGRPQLLTDAVLSEVEDAPLPLGELARLWRSALLRPWTAADAWDVLERWLTNADGLPDVADALVELLSRVLVNPLLHDRFCFYMLHRWRYRMPASVLLDRLEVLARSRPGG